MKDYSQSGEQLEILRIFDTIGIDKGHLVDLGAGDGYTMSNSRALLEKGWTGDLYDGDPKGAHDVRKAWIDLEWATYTFRNLDCDFLNIDLDGNDYWILNEAIQWNPILVVAEINPIFERHDAKVMPYNQSHVWKGDTYYGMSLAACEKLAMQYGYTLIHLHAGINAFLLRNDYASHFDELIRPIEYRVKHDHFPHNPALPWTAL